MSSPKMRRLFMAAATTMATLACSAATTLTAEEKAQGQAGQQTDVQVPEYFRKIGPLGAESPRTLAGKFIGAVLEGDRDAVISCYRLDTVNSLIEAAVFA